MTSVLTIFTEVNPGSQVAHGKESSILKSQLAPGYMICVCVISNVL